MLEVLAAAACGVAAGIVFGLVPGLHPNMVVLFVPFLAGFGSAAAVVFVVSLGMANVMASFVPSVLLSAPDAGSELASLPGRRLVQQGHGYAAVKLAVIGALGGTLLAVLLLPLLALSIPALYAALSPYLYVVLIAIVAVMIVSEKGVRKLWAALLFLLAGAVGVLTASLPVDPALVLFPVFSGLFGAPLLLSSGAAHREQKQHGELFVSAKSMNRAVVSGTAGGVMAGVLPSIGTSEIAALTSVEKNDRAFLISLGAITAANVLVSVATLWLIDRARSGIAIAVSQITEVGAGETLLVAAAALAAAGVAAVATLALARKSLHVLERVGYKKVGLAVLLFLASSTAAFTGVAGLILFVTCGALGVLANAVAVKRGILMGVLILPTILFYLPV